MAQRKPVFRSDPKRKADQIGDDSDDMSPASKLPKIATPESNLVSSIVSNNTKEFTANLALYLQHERFSLIRDSFIKIARSPFIKHLVELRRTDMMNDILNALIDIKARSLPYGDLIKQNPDSPINLASAKNALARILIQQITGENRERMIPFITAFIENFEVKLNLKNYFWGDIKGSVEYTMYNSSNHLFRELHLFATSKNNFFHQICFTLSALIKNNEEIPDLESLIPDLTFNARTLDNAMDQYELIQLLFAVTQKPRVLHVAKIDSSRLAADTINLLLESGYTLSLETCPSTMLAEWGQFSAYRRVVTNAPDIDYCRDLITCLRALNNRGGTLIPILTPTYCELIVFLLSKLDEISWQGHIEILGPLVALTRQHDSQALYDIVPLALALELKIKASFSSSREFNKYYHFFVSLLEDTYPPPVAPESFNKIKLLLLEFTCRKSNSAALLLDIIFKNANKKQLDSEKAPLIQFLLENKKLSHHDLQEYVLKNLQTNAGRTRCFNLIECLRRSAYALSQSDKNGMTLLENCLVNIANAPDSYKDKEDLCASLFLALEGTINIKQPNRFQFKDRNMSILQLINEEPSLAQARAEMLNIPAFRHAVQLDARRDQIAVLVHSKQPRKIDEDKQSTHSAGVHKSVSESAQRLFKRYYPDLAAPSQITEDEIVTQVNKLFYIPICIAITNEFRVRLENKYARYTIIPQEIRTQMIDDRLSDFKLIHFSHIRNADVLEGIANYPLLLACNLFKFCYNEHKEFIDPVSSINLRLVFVLALKALYDDTIFKTEDHRQSEFRLFANHLALLDREYGNRPSCPSGVFNGSVEFFDGKHPDVKIVRISGENILFYIRDFFEGLFEKLPPFEKNQLANTAKQLNRLPPEFVAQHKAAFYQSVAYAIEGAYIAKDLVDIWFDEMTGVNVLFQFPAIKNFIPDLTAPGPHGLFGASLTANQAQIIDAMDIDTPQI